MGEKQNNAPTRAEIEDFVEKKEFNNAIDALRDDFRKAGNKRERNVCILSQARWNRLLMLQVKGGVTEEFARNETAQIRKVVLGILEKMG